MAIRIRSVSHGSVLRHHRSLRQRLLIATVDVSDPKTITIMYRAAAPASGIRADGDASEPPVNARRGYQQHQLEHIQHGSVQA